MKERSTSMAMLLLLKAMTMMVLSFVLGVNLIGAVHTFSEDDGDGDHIEMMISQ